MNSLARKDGGKWAVGKSKNCGAGAIQRLVFAGVKKLTNQYDPYGLTRSGDAATVIFLSYRSS
jgi:hypothetical protein